MSVAHDRRRHVNIETFGCQMNEYDSELVRALLTREGFVLTEDRECADVKTMAFILLVANDGSIRRSTIAQVDSFRRVWEQYANGPTFGGKGARGMMGDDNYIKKVDTSLNPQIH